MLMILKGMKLKKFFSSYVDACYTKKKKILKYSDSKGNLYCTPVVLLYCASLVSHMAYRGLLQVFKKFHLFEKTGFEAKLSNTQQHPKVQLQSI